MYACRAVSRREFDLSPLTQVFRAASPRTKCAVGPTPEFPMSLPNRKRVISEVAEELNALRRREVPTVYEGVAPNMLWVVVNRLVNAKIPDTLRKTHGLTLICMHANGFHKEVNLPFVR